MCICINQLFVRADDEDQAAELSRLLDQKAYLEELNKKLEYVIYIYSNHSICMVDSMHIECFHLCIYRVC